MINPHESEPLRPNTPEAHSHLSPLAGLLLDLGPARAPVGLCVGLARWGDRIRLLTQTADAGL